MILSHLLFYLIGIHYTSFIALVIDWNLFDVLICESSLQIASILWKFSLIIFCEEQMMNNQEQLKMMKNSWIISFWLENQCENHDFCVCWLLKLKSQTQRVKIIFSKFNSMDWKLKLVDRILKSIVWCRNRIWLESYFQMDCS